MFVIKRNGQQESMMFDKITLRIQSLSSGLCVNPTLVSQKVIGSIFSGITTTAIDTHASEVSAYLSLSHPDYSTLASRIIVSNLHKNTPHNFSDAMKLAHEQRVLSDDFFALVTQNSQVLNKSIHHERDYNFDFFGFKTLERSYLIRIDNGSKIIERPQYLLLRTALAIHTSDIPAALETYEGMSKGLFIHATPTLFNSGTRNQQLSSCFLINMKEDSIDGIYDTLKQCAITSKYGGGIGLSVHNIRAKNSYIRGTNGISNGLAPMLKLFNNTARYVDQGGGKRKGAIAIYVEPWHADIFEILNLKRNSGAEEFKTRDLFFGLWIPDLFMQRVVQNADWSLMCPDECPGLDDVYGDKFGKLYVEYEQSGKVRRRIKAQDLWNSIIQSQIETGTPYMLYKDACNQKSNQQNLGTIKSSNLCTEIIEYSSPTEIAVCNLASIALPKCVNQRTKEFDYARLEYIVRVLVQNLNKIIDNNYYPLEEMRRSNLNNRPIGIGVQGLADVFILMHIPFESDAARALNKRIFECIYYSSLDESANLAQKYGHYATYAGSPVHAGIIQPDMWNVELSDEMFPWTQVRQKIKMYGVRNSLMVAPMPTASTSQILRNNECIEPYTSNIYTRRVLAGDFPIINKHLIDNLTELGLWSHQLSQKIIEHNGSIQDIDEIPLDIRQIYKTVWEISQKHLINMAIDRAPFIDQSQSLNLFIELPTINKISSMHFYAWSNGLKTGMYYLRTKAASKPIKFTLDLEKPLPIAPNLPAAPAPQDQSLLQDQSPPPTQSDHQEITQSTLTGAPMDVCRVEVDESGGKRPEQ